MASFSPNDCDIILDAVITDNGRRLLANGDGSFQITKFAVGDAEIDYETFNKTHASGSAYYDLEILQTPLLEAFTDNAIGLPSKLISYQNPNLLYLPMLKLNENHAQTKRHTSGFYVVGVNLETEGSSDTCTDKAVGYDSAGNMVPGIIFGASLNEGAFIRVDQGLDTTELPPTQRPDPELIEDAYMLQFDSKLGSIVTINGDRIGEDFRDDDGINFYTVTRADGVIRDNPDISNSAGQTIRGPRGTILEFKIAASSNLTTSNFLFTKIGRLETMETKGGTNQNIRAIDALVRCTGMKTGYTIDIPVRLVKAIN